MSFHDSVKHRDYADDPSSIAGKDYILKVSIRNGPLLRAIRMRGFKTIVSAATACGIALQSMYGYLSLKRAPIDSKGKWKDSALKLAKGLRLPPDCLWPEQHLQQALKQSSGEIEASADDIAQFIQHQRAKTPEQELIEQQEDHILHKMLSDRLTAREERVIRLRFGMDGKPERTLREVGDLIGVSPERIRGIEARSFRKLKHPRNWNVLEDSGADKVGFSVSWARHKRREEKAKHERWRQEWDSRKEERESEFLDRAKQRVREAQERDEQFQSDPERAPILDNLITSFSKGLEAGIGLHLKFYPGNSVEQAVEMCSRCKHIYTLIRDVMAPRYMGTSEDG